jgi:hypothetical protein
MSTNLTAGGFAKDNRDALHPKLKQKVPFETVKFFQLICFVMIRKPPDTAKKLT